MVSSISVSLLKKHILRSAGPSEFSQVGLDFLRPQSPLSLSLKLLLSDQSQQRRSSPDTCHGKLSSEPGPVPHRDPAIRIQSEATGHCLWGCALEPHHTWTPGQRSLHRNPCACSKPCLTWLVPRGIKSYFFLRTVILFFPNSRVSR